MVYEDYRETVQQLRASYNRVMNGLESSAIPQQLSERCTKECDFLHKFHMEQNEKIVAMLRAACDARDGARIKAALQVMNRHSRSLARLSRLLQTDIADYHPDFDDPNLVLRPVAPGTPVGVNVFITKLAELRMAIERRQYRQLTQPPAPAP